MSLTKLTLLSAGGAAVLLAACGGTADTTSSGSASQAGGSTQTGSASTSGVPGIPGGVPGVVDACSLVSADQAGAVTGVTMTKLAAASTGPTCVYTGADQKPAVLIDVTPGGGAGGTAAIDAALQGQIHDSNGQATPVSGVGDTAALIQSSDGAGIAFTKGQTLAIVAVTNATSPVDTGKLTDLAKQLAGQL